MGNLGSVSNACRFLHLPARILSRPDEISECNALILPGVGAFGDCMRHLDEHGFVEPVKKWIADDKPFLGICLGLQVLFESGEESPGVPGLGIFSGTVRRFAGSPDVKVPQIGWNRVYQRQKDCLLFDGIADGTHFYFVHSFYVDCRDQSLIAGETSHGITYTSAIRRGRLVAVQFHPEKSQSAGLAMLRNFAGHVESGRAAA